MSFCFYFSILKGKLQGAVIFINHFFEVYREQTGSYITGDMGLKKVMHYSSQDFQSLFACCRILVLRTVKFMKFGLKRSPRTTCLLCLSLQNMCIVFSSSGRAV